MNEWNDGYFTSDTYTYGYYRELQPTYQNIVLLLQGYVPIELNEKSCHCESGFGQGVSINIHATATPGKYYGTDFNPAHAAQANEFLNFSKANAEFYDDSFEQMLNRNDLPQFDSINLHGIWSWISPENQEIIIKFAKKYLKPGGLFYNSYNCYPGWSAKAPVRELLILFDKFVGETESNIDKRVQGSINFIEELMKSKPLFAQSSPLLEGFLNNLKTENAHYLVHEYFNRDWICEYFTDMVEKLSKAKLDWVSTCVPLDSIDKANLNATAIEFLNKIDNPIMREQTRDYFVNRQFRKDLFIRGARKISNFERANRLMNMKFVLITPNEISMKHKTVLGEATFHNEDANELIEYLRDDDYKPKKFADLIKKNPKVNFDNVVQFITLMLEKGLLMPCQSEETIEQVKDNCDRLNEYLFNRAKSELDNISVLASPVIGGGIVADRFVKIFAGMYKQGIRSIDTMANMTWNIIDSQNQRLANNGEILQTKEENITELKSMLNNFFDMSLPILKATQIV